MSRRPSAVLLGTLALAAFLAGAARAPAADKSAPDDGVEVLARGPVHEAYAEPVTGQPQAPPAVEKRPPEPIPELPPDQRPEGDRVQWVPGYWSWDVDKNDFVWVSGFWREPPPGRQWVPGHWDKGRDGWLWVPGFWAPGGKQEIEYVPPPPATVEEGPSLPAPYADMVYAPGSWVYRDGRWLWRPGSWIDARTGLVWVPAHYAWTPAGCLLVDGYWDYPLRQRGLLFAPVYVPPRVVVRADWSYVPRYVVRDDFLLSALFVRPGYGHYYFGDYFEPRYQKLGFTAWVDFRIGSSVPDPLFAYYRNYHGGDRRWERDLRDLYAARYAGDVPRPPRTLAQQNTLLENVNKTANVKNVTVLAPLPQVDRQVAKLQTVTREERLREQQAGDRARELAQQRRQAERQLLEKGSPPVKPNDPPRVVKLDLPKPQPGKTAGPEPKVAPPVVTPKRDERTLPPAKDVVPPPKKDATPPPTKREVVPPPPKKEVVPPTPPRKEAVPPPKNDVVPPTPKKDIVPPPPTRKEAVPPKKEVVTPPPLKKETAAPPKKEAVPPPPLKKEVAPTPPPKKDVVPPPVKREVVPPSPKREVAPPVKKEVAPPPTKKQVQVAPPPSAKKAVQVTPPVRQAPSRPAAAAKPAPAHSTRKK